MKASSSHRFMLALAVVGQTDLVAALPRSQVRAHGARFGVVAAELPVAVGPFRVCAVAPRAAMADAGVAWLVGLLEATSPGRDGPPPPPSPRGLTRPRSM